MRRSAGSAACVGSHQRLPMILTICLTGAAASSGDSAIGYSYDDRRLERHSLAGRRARCCDALIPLAVARAAELGALLAVPVGGCHAAASVLDALYALAVRVGL
eukprot:3406518-Prymnesium_polylepis.2